jgi:YVTN family beta-propeller protein
VHAPHGHFVFHRSLARLEEAIAVNTLTRSLLPAAVAATLAACGGGGGYGDDGNNNPPPPPPVTLADGQFVLERFDGLGVSSTGANDAVTDATGKFKFAVGQDVRLFVGQAGNKLTIGTVTPTAVNGGIAPIGLQDLKEVQNDNDQVLGNILVLLRALDADGDPTNGVKIDAAANAAVAKVVAGGKTVNFNQAAASFAADPLIAALLAELKRQLADAKAALIDFSELFPQSRSSSIALTSDDKRLVVVNRQKASASVFRVRADDGSDVNEPPVEVTIGKEPRYVAITPDNKRALVTNTIEGSVSVIDLTAAKPAVVGTPINVGIEPRGIAITPNGTYAFVANFTTGEVTVIRLSTLEVVRSIKTGGNPQAVAITNDGDKNDLDERVYVTRMFGEVIDPERPDGFDDAKQGVIDTFTVGAAVNGTAQVSQVTLAPFDSGFKADRSQFCQATRDASEGSGDPANPLIFFNSGPTGTTGPDADPADNLAAPTFCPDLNATTAAAVASVPQNVYPNMLYSALIRGRHLYVPNVGASPEPPVKFNVNVQGLVGVIDRTLGDAGTEDKNLSLNLNAQVAKETVVGDPKKTLDKLFLNDLVAVDADRGGRNFLFVSRGGNYVLRAGLDTNFKINILEPGTPPAPAFFARRLQTGNMPTGVVMSSDGKRAYVDNELNMSVTALDLANNTVLARDMESSKPPAIDSQEHRNLVGKLVFFTALGVPEDMDGDNNSVFDVALRDIVPLADRGKASDNAWSSCASCHEDGHSDNVTWIFETGPRQTIPLEGMFTHKTAQFLDRLKDQRVLNWSAVRGSNTDFNANAIGIQGGTGFAGSRAAEIFNHGPIFGISDSLDALQEWVATVRAPIVPDLANEAPGRAVFDANCASCHGGDKWTKSRTAPLYASEPADVSGLPAVFAQNPIGVRFFDDGGKGKGVLPFDREVDGGGAVTSGLDVNGPQLLSVTRDGAILKLLDDVGTFVAPSLDPNVKAGRLELRGAAAVGTKNTTPGPGLQSTQGFIAFGKAGFNSPSLLGLSMSAPYLHDGSAQTLEEVAAKHRLTALGAPFATVLGPQQTKDVLDFIRSIDDNTTPSATKSLTDAFLEAHPQN